jgi:membrane-bound lytic murein transglycosylase F
VVTVSVDQEPALPPRDLDQITADGTLRVLVHRPESQSLERTGSPLDRELAQVELFARSRSLGLRLVNVPTRAMLMQALLEGRGDLIAAQYTHSPARARRVRFSHPVRYVKEQVVASTQATDLPGTKADLAGRRVWVGDSSSFRETLEQLNLSPPVQPQPVDESLNAHEVFPLVAQGKYELCVMDSDVVESYLSYRDDIQVVLTLQDKVPIAWAGHPGAARLMSAVNAFLQAHVQPQYGPAIYKEDLEALRERGVLRVAMTNNANSYFFYQGQPWGYHYSVSQRLAQYLGLRLEVVIARRPEDLLPLLEEGRADVVAAVLTRTPAREARVDFSAPVTYVDEILVQPTGEPSLTHVEQLGGRQVHVRRSSAYWSTLAQLSSTVPTLELVAADESLETEQLIARVGQGEIPLTVADYDILTLGLSPRATVKGTLILGRQRPRSFAVRKDSPALRRALDTAAQREYFRQHDAGSDAIASHGTPDASRVDIPSGQLSPWDDLARSRGKRYNLDWRLLVSMMRLASGFDPNYESWYGAQGLFQMMPHMLRGLGMPLSDLRDPELATEAAARHLRDLLEHFSTVQTPKDRLNLALAAFHVGREHLDDARALASSQGLDPNRWSGHVAKALVMLEDPTWANQARFGYCRGQAAVDYVDQVNQAWHQALRQSSATP